MSDANKLVELAKDTQGATASGGLIGVSVYAGTYVKSFMQPYDFYASLTCTVGLVIGVCLFAIVAIKSVFFARPQNSTTPI